MNPSASPKPDNTVNTPMSTTEFKARARVCENAVARDHPPGRRKFSPGCLLNGIGFQIKTCAGGQQRAAVHMSSVSQARKLCLQLERKTVAGFLGRLVFAKQRERLTQ